MKNVILLLALFCGPLFGQAYLPIGLTYTDSLDQSAMACFPYACSVSASNTWMIQSNFEGIVSIEASPIADYTIVITTGDDSSRIETCMQLANYAGGGACFIYKFSESTRLTVSGPMGANMFIRCDTVAAPLSLPIGIRSMVNLCGNATDLDEIAPKHRQFYELNELIRGNVRIVSEADRLPNAIYKELK